MKSFQMQIGVIDLFFAFKLGFFLKWCAVANQIIKRKRLIHMSDFSDGPHHENEDWKVKRASKAIFKKLMPLELFM